MVFEALEMAPQTRYLFKRVPPSHRTRAATGTSYSQPSGILTRSKVSSSSKSIRKLEVKEVVALLGPPTKDQDIDVTRVSLPETFIRRSRSPPLPTRLGLFWPEHTKESQVYG